jgi:hypothetical protein
LHEKSKNYWNCCKSFEWSEDIEDKNNG